MKKRIEIDKELKDLGVNIPLIDRELKGDVEDYFSTFQDNVLNKAVYQDQHPGELYFEKLQDQVFKKVERPKKKSNYLMWSSAAVFLLLISSMFIFNGMLNSDEVVSPSFVEQLSEEELFYIIEEYSLEEDIIDEDLFPTSLSTEEEYLLEEDGMLEELLINETF